VPAITAPLPGLRLPDRVDRRGDTAAALPAGATGRSTTATASAGCGPWCWVPMTAPSRWRGRHRWRPVSSCRCSRRRIRRRPIWPGNGGSWSAIRRDTLRARPIQAALASAASFTLGFLVPILAISLAPDNRIAVVTTVAALLALWRCSGASRPGPEGLRCCGACCGCWCGGPRHEDHGPGGAPGRGRDLTTWPRKPMRAIEVDQGAKLLMGFRR